MGQRADNDIFLSIDGVTVSAYFQEVKLEGKVDGKDVTAGAGQDWMQRKGGLKDASATIKLTYDDTNVDDYLTHISMGDLVVVIYGPEGNTTGMPKHQQLMLVESVGFPITVGKDPIAFDISLTGAETPVKDMFAGDVW